MKEKKYSKGIYVILFISAVGYFVDAYDLWIAALVRSRSLFHLLQLDPTAQSSIALVKSIAYSLENWQNAGLLLGILWGVLADKFGRKRALYTSIALYSLANLANAFLTPNTPYLVEIYKTLRFLSGVGLAAELSIAITLVSEVFPKEKRGYGIMIIVAFGLLGSAFAAFLAEFSKLNWNNLYIIGGVLGLLLLLIRTRLTDSKMYISQEKSNISKGNFFVMFTDNKLRKKLIVCVLLGAPTYFIISIPIKFATNYSQYVIDGKISLPITVISFFIAASIGDILANYLSQITKSRKKVLLGYLVFAAFVVSIFCIVKPHSAFEYHFIYTPLLGLSAGYWTLLLTIVAEQWGTNLRATATTTIPNFIRALALPIVPIFVYLNSIFATMAATAILGLGTIAVAIISWFFISESFGKDLDYVDNI